MILPVKPRPSTLMPWRGNEKKIFISGEMLAVIALISYFLIADDGGDFTVSAQGTKGVQCAGCLDIWDGKGQFVDMIWEASP